MPGGMCAYQWCCHRQRRRGCVQVPLSRGAVKGRAALSSLARPILLRNGNSSLTPTRKPNTSINKRRIAQRHNNDCVGLGLQRQSGDARTREACFLLPLSLSKCQWSGWEGGTHPRALPGLVRAAKVGKRQQSQDENAGRAFEGEREGSIKWAAISLRGAHARGVCLYFFGIGEGG
jgi:hypothetical protein